MDATSVPSPASAFGQEPRTGPIPSLDSLLELDNLNPPEKDKVTGPLSNSLHCLIGSGLQLPSLTADESQCRSIARKRPWCSGPIPDGLQTLPCTLFTPAATPKCFPRRIIQLSKWGNPVRIVQLVLVNKGFSERRFVKGAWRDGAS